MSLQRGSLPPTRSSSAFSGQHIFPFFYLPLPMIYLLFLSISTPILSDILPHSFPFPPLAGRVSRPQLWLPTCTKLVQTQTYRSIVDTSSFGSVPDHLATYTLTYAKAELRYVGETST